VWVWSQSKVPLLLRRGRFFKGSDTTDEGVSGAWNTLADGCDRTEALALYWDAETAGYLLLGFFFSVAKDLKLAAVRYASTVLSSKQGHAIILYYLNICETLMLRPRDVTFGGGSIQALSPSAVAAPPPPCFCRLFLVERACEAFVLPFWDNCIALAESRACF
jgi:hypothetical protein